MTPEDIQEEYYSDEKYSFFRDWKDDNLSYLKQDFIEEHQTEFNTYKNQQGYYDVIEEDFIEINQDEFDMYCREIFDNRGD